MKQTSLYTQAGVDIDAGDRVKKRIAELTRQTFTPNVLHQDGAFGGMFSLDSINMNHPVLVSSVDGVGTKIKVAIAYGEHKGIGIDLVNHCIDDLLPCGAKPLFFLDYFACGKQQDDIVLQLIEGMSEACQSAGMALIGGETAQMPDLYADDDYDLAGTIVGIVEKDQMIDPTRIQIGDVILGLPSSGLHTNGYTLARNVLLDKAGFKLDDTPEGLNQPLGKALLQPHHSYLLEIETLKQYIPIHGLAHITGGGFEGNLSRILPDGCKAILHTSSWEVPPVFQLIHHHGDVSDEEMYRVFNMGIGMCVVTHPDHIQQALASSPEIIEIGKIVEGDGVLLQ